MYLPPVSTYHYKPKEASFIDKHVVSRVTNLILAPLALLAAAADVISGVPPIISSIITLGRSNTNCNVAGDTSVLLSSSKKILSAPYLNLLRVINPNAKADEQTDGMVYDLLCKPLVKKGMEFYMSPKSNFLEKHVVSRLTFALYGIAALVSRAVDGILAIPAVIASVCSLGIWDDANNAAYKGLRFTGVVHSVFFSVIKIINPGARLG